MDTRKIIHAPKMTVGDMPAFVKNTTKEMGFPDFLAGFFTKGISKLKRWKTSAAQM
jgi:hypothetical protein